MVSETNKENKNKSFPKYVKVIIIIVCILVILIVFLILKNSFVKSNSWNIVNQTSLVGTLITFLGFFYTIFQIFRLKSISETIQTQVNKTLNNFSTVLTISDLSSYIEVVKNCQNNIIENKIELAHLRLQNIKKILIEINNINIDISFLEINLEEKITIVSGDIQSLSQIISNPKKQLNVNKINTNLENIITIFSELVVKIKYNKDGRSN